MGFLLKFILFALVFYYLLKTIGHILVRVVSSGRQGPSRSRGFDERKEGEIKIDYAPGKGKNKHSSHIGDKEGDYIDYEEVKE